MKKHSSSPLSKQTARALAAISLAACTFIPAVTQAEETSASDDWKLSGGLYLWGASISTTLKRGPETTLDFDEILDHLDATFMGNLEARHDKFFLATDVVYLDLSGSNQIALQPAIGDIALGGSFDLKAKINTTIAGYNLIDSNTGTLDAFAGVRYIGIDTTVKVTSIGPLGGHYKKATPEGDSTDGVVGVKGKLNLEGNWSLPYYLDIGSGDSDSTWQTFGGIDYLMDNTKIYAGYRYLEWDFGGAIDKLTVDGPVIGFNYNF